MTAADIADMTAADIAVLLACTRAVLRGISKSLTYLSYLFDLFDNNESSIDGLLSSSSFFSVATAFLYWTRGDKGEEGELLSMVACLASGNLLGLGDLEIC